MNFESASEARNPAGPRGAHRFLSVREHRAQDAAWLLIAATLALAPAFSKPLNIGWILLFLITVVLFVRSGAFRSGVRADPVLSRAAQPLLLCFSLGLVAKLAMQVYWGEAGQKLAFEINATVAAGLAWALGRLRWQHASWLPVVLGLGVWTALALGEAVQAFALGDFATPTNAVNWAAGMAVMLCLVLGLALVPSLPFGVGLLLRVAVVLLAITVLLSGKRGAYFALLWAAGIGCAVWLAAVLHRASRRQALTGLLVVGLLGLAIAWASPSWLERPVERLVTGLAQGLSFLKSSGETAVLPEGSVDTRLYLYQRGFESIRQAPWLGGGWQQRDRVVEQVEQQIGQPLFHLHSETIDAWVAYGLPGLFASLCFPAGLVLGGWRVRRHSMPLAAMLVGLGLCHLFSGFSNVNTFHNYYQTLFAVCVVLPFFWWPLMSPARTAPGR